MLSKPRRSPPIGRATPSGAYHSSPTAQGPLAPVRPDMRIVVADDFEKLADRLDGTLRVMREIVKLAASARCRRRRW